MCVVNKQFKPLEFVFIPFMLTCGMMIFLSLLLLRLCACVVFVLSVRLSSYHMWNGSCGDCAACTVVCVACVYDERACGCEGNFSTGVEDGVVVFVVSTGYECMGCTRGSGVVSSAYDALEMRVVHE